MLDVPLRSRAESPLTFPARSLPQPAGLPVGDGADAYAHTSRTTSITRQGDPAGMPIWGVTPSPSPGCQHRPAQEQAGAGLQGAGLVPVLRRENYCDRMLGALSLVHWRRTVRLDRR